MTLTATDGRHDFDFYFGHWRIHNRKLADILDKNCTEWVEFDAVNEMRPILNGLGNFDTFVPVGLPEDKHFEGATLRMFDPATGLWRIWWASSRTPDRLDVPVPLPKPGHRDHGRIPARGRASCSRQVRCFH